jgi:hypothetical protein
MFSPGARPSDALLCSLSRIIYYSNIILQFYAILMAAAPWRRLMLADDTTAGA